MTTTLADLRPADAWQRFEPPADRPFDRRLAAHLYRRAGLAATSRELDEAVKLGVDGTVKQLLSPDERAAKFDREMHDFAQVTLAANNPELLAVGIQHCAVGYGDAQCLTCGAMPVGALPVLAVARLQAALEMEVEQCVDVWIDDEHDVAAVAAVATVGPAQGLELLAVDRHTAVPTLTGYDL